MTGPPADWLTLRDRLLHPRSQRDRWHPHWWFGREERSWSPAAGRCGRERPRDSRSGDRRYSWANALLLLGDLGAEW